MSALLVGYAQCSTDQQDLTAQRDALLGLGVEAERVYVDHGLTGTNASDLDCARHSPPAGPVTRWW
jgi:DNA invertase Pin-like site-specific DNA recombinase